MAPADLPVRMTHDVPLLWAEANGREWLASVPAVTPVVVRGVDPAAMEPGEDGHGRPKAGFRNRVWFPYRRVTHPRGITPAAFRDECEAAPPDAFAVRFAAPLSRKGSAYPAPRQALARVLEMHEEAARAWVSHAVDADMVHDGRIVWVADPLGTVDGARPSAERWEEENFMGLVARGGMQTLSDASQLPRHSRGPGYEESLSTMRRVLVRAHSRALGPEQRRPALEALAKLADMVKAAPCSDIAFSRAAEVRSRLVGMMGRSMSELVLPEGDADALGALGP